MTDFAAMLREALGAGTLGALPIAFAGGLLTGLNPCCLPLYPAAAATCCAPAGNPGQRHPAVSAALAFVAGTAIATAALGLAAALAGGALTRLGGWLPYAIAVVPLAAGAHLLGVLPLPAMRMPSAMRVAGAPGAFLAGLLLSLALGACGTPILAAILSFAAYKANVPFGGLLLFVYGIGAGVPVLLFGTAIGAVAKNLAGKGFQPWIQRTAGILLVGTGLYVLWSA